MQPNRTTATTQLRTSLVRVLGGDARLAANDEPTVHTLSREGSSSTLDGFKQVACTCGWRGPKRFECENYMRSLLRSDELEHLSHIAGQA